MEGWQNMNYSKNSNFLKNSKKHEQCSSFDNLQTTDNGFTEIPSKSKTQKKKEATALQVLGEKLVKLPAKQLEKIDLPEDVYDAVRFARTIRKYGALKRHMRYIGTLMRKIDHIPVQEALYNIEQGY